MGNVVAEPRAEVVGSLLRSEAVLRAVRRGSLADQAVINDAVRDAIRLQEEAGVDVMTDGEARRLCWVDTPRLLDCFANYEGYAALEWCGGVPVPAGSDADSGTDPTGSRTTGGGTTGGPTGSGRGAEYPAVVQRVATAQHLGDLIDGYEFLAKHARIRTKFTMPAPSYHRRYWSRQHSRDAYDSVEQYLTEIRDWLREYVDRLLALGCDYIQLDAPNYGSLCDPDTRARMAAEGRDPEAELAFDAELDNSLFDGLNGGAAAGGAVEGGAVEGGAVEGGAAAGGAAAGGAAAGGTVERGAAAGGGPSAAREITTALHICRGNNPRGIWHSAEGYAAVSGTLFPRLNFSRLMLEYDSDRDGFQALSDVRDGTTAVLGLVSIRPGDPDEEDAVRTRISEAARIKPLEELALSTQCGFASEPPDNAIGPAVQRAKLHMVARIARDVWGP